MGRDSVSLLLTSLLFTQLITMLFNQTCFLLLLQTDSAGLERVFSTIGFDHSDLINRLDSEVIVKLAGPCEQSTPLKTK